jgi:hypothetical protein
VVRVLDLLVVSCLVGVEVPAAIWRKRRLGELSEEDARILTGEFEADYYGGDIDSSRFVIVALTAQILDRAAALARTNGFAPMMPFSSPPRWQSGRRMPPARRWRVSIMVCAALPPHTIPAPDLIYGRPSSRWPDATRGPHRRLCGSEELQISG